MRAYMAEPTPRVNVTTTVDSLVPIGVVQPFIGTTAPNGWLMLNGDSIGDTGSGATQADATYEDLFKLFWDSMTDTHAPVSTGRGASAQADWNAGKTLTMPDPSGRSIVGTGTGAGLTARTHGDDSIGAEDAIVVTHLHAAGTLAADSAGAHPHNIQGEDDAPGGGGGQVTVQLNADGDGFNNTSDNGGAVSAGAHPHTISGSTANDGSSGTDANMMPALALNFIIKAQIIIEAFRL